MKLRRGAFRAPRWIGLALLLCNGISWGVPEARRVTDFDTLGVPLPRPPEPPAQKRNDRVPVPVVPASSASRIAAPEGGRPRPCPRPGNRALPPSTTALIPGSAGRLDLCSEYTKPHYLRIRLLGTPQNHRSPPA